MNDKQKEALNYLAQLANDFINTLPASAKGPTMQMAQQAINVLESSLTPVKETEAPK